MSARSATKNPSLCFGKLNSPNQALRPTASRCAARTKVKIMNYATLFGLLQRWGDRPFSRVLRAQKRPVRKAVMGEITTFPGWKPAEFPLTNALVKS